MWSHKISDIIKWWPLTFQNQLSQTGIKIDWLHDYILILLIFVLVLVGGALIILVNENWTWFATRPSQTLEIIWTLVPALTLFFVGIPSLSTLYQAEKRGETSLSLKITGHQWYWSYDYLDFETTEFDRFIKPRNDLLHGEFRNLEVDNRVVVPIGARLVLLISSSDVLHSWALPRVRLKGDANPGRLNIVIGTVISPGIYYGQCSELCGANHSFIPIGVERTSPPLFVLWSIIIV